jgi:hypothetical protein
MGEGSTQQVPAIPQGFLHLNNDGNRHKSSSQSLTIPHRTAVTGTQSPSQMLELPPQGQSQSGLLLRDSPGS